jgi:hypothetical protein
MCPFEQRTHVTWNVAFAATTPVANTVPSPTVEFIGTVTVPEMEPSAAAVEVDPVVKMLPKSLKVTVTVSPGTKPDPVTVTIVL